MLACSVESFMVIERSIAYSEKGYAQHHTKKRCTFSAEQCQIKRRSIHATTPKKGEDNDKNNKSFFNFLFLTNK